MRGIHPRVWLVADQTRSQRWLVLIESDDITATFPRPLPVAEALMSIVEMTYTVASATDAQTYPELTLQALEGELEWHNITSASMLGFRHVCERSIRKPARDGGGDGEPGGRGGSRRGRARMGSRGRSQGRARGRGGDAAAEGDQAEQASHDFIIVFA